MLLNESVRQRPFIVFIYPFEKITHRSFFLPKHVKTIPELFKEASYFTFNHGKDDYNFTYDRKALYSGAYAEHPLYGKSGLKIDWNDRKDKSQPFFGQIQLKGGKHIFSKKFKRFSKKLNIF